MEESKDQLSTSASSANSGSVQGEKDDALSTLPESDAETQAATTPSTEEDWVTGPRLWFILSGVSLVLFMMLLDVSIISTVSLIKHMLLLCKLNSITGDSEDH